MKRSGKKLDELLRANPIKVEPTGKEKLLAYIREQYAEESGKGEIMKKHNYKRILIIAAAAVCLTMMVSAAVVSYIYRTPDGEFVDEQGKTVDAEVEYFENSRGIHGEGYSIRSVTWTTANGRTTLAVWVDSDTKELDGLCAVIGGQEYPLERKNFNLNSNCTGYTATGMEKPSEFILKCASPAFEENVSFIPEDVIPAESYSNGITLIGTTSGRTVYIGINDEYYLTSDIFRGSEISIAIPSTAVATDNTGAEYADSSGGTVRDGNMLTQIDFDKKIPLGNNTTRLSVEGLRVVYSYMESAREGTSPSVSIPVPDDGKTIEGTWALLNSDGFTYVINSVARKGNELLCKSEDGLTYSGVYQVSEENSGYIYPSVYGEHICGGSNKEWSLIFAEGELEELGENGEIPVHLFEMGINYVGDWVLEFTDTENLRR